MTDGTLTKTVSLNSKPTRLKILHDANPIIHSFTGTMCNILSVFVRYVVFVANYCHVANVHVLMAGTQPFEAAAASRIAPCRHAQRICRKLRVAKRIDDPIFEGLLVLLFWMMRFYTLTLVQECKEPWCHLMACHETFFGQFKEHNGG